MQGNSELIPFNSKVLATRNKKTFKYFKFLLKLKPLGD